ncbi:hypothetical protein PCANC_21773 [Puccinia coronata f. sp. avenae]|uniref:C2H2-type domain-containing protein n=1 Tax=Puccinia coronata f. sp. avenae TaxID=200324 RepID=A0A2N5TUU4_9BASI|nr:hypothetical protein PCANC_21773 [Puccinia coronata f. sp. avenae]
MNDDPANAPSPTSTQPQPHTEPHLVAETVSQDVHMDLDAVPGEKKMPESINPTDSEKHLPLPEKTSQAEAVGGTGEAALKKKTQTEAAQDANKKPILCKPCNRTFDLHANYENHLKHSPRHFYCKPCKKDFLSEEARRSHQAHAKAHQTCKWCKDQEIGNLALHNRVSHWECRKCKKLLENYIKYNDHCRSAHPKIYCVGCLKLYKNSNDLKMHHLSHYHQFRSFTCPSPECRAAFLSESGVIAHLESGCCSSGVDQAMIDKSMVIRDPRQLFVRGARVSLPADREVPVQAGLYPCSLCPKKFQYRAGLLQHLGSSKHTNNGRDPYKCPASTCNKPTFPSLSSLLVHKERGKCGLDRDTALITTLDRYIYDLFDRIRNM